MVELSKNFSIPMENSQNVFMQKKAPLNIFMTTKEELVKNTVPSPAVIQLLQNTIYIDANTIKTIYKDRSNSRDLEKTYHFSNGNLIREEDSRGTIVYEYDDKNNWMYNNNFIITISSVLGEFFDYDYSKNNVTKIIVRGNRSEDYRYEDATTTFQYEYNSDNYPTKVTQTKDGRVQKVTEYQY